MKISIDDIWPTSTPQGQKIYEFNSLLADDHLARAGIGIVFMPDGHISKAHLHDQDWVYVTVIRGQAWTLLGPDLSEIIFQGVGDTALIPPGVPHAAIACQGANVYALEHRVGPHQPADFSDVVLLPKLQKYAVEQADFLHGICDE